MVPPTPWLAQSIPAKPRVQSARLTGSPERRRVRVFAADATDLTHLAVWRKAGGVWSFAVQPVADRDVKLPVDPARGPVEAVVLSVVDRLGQESERVVVVTKPTG